MNLSRVNSYLSKHFNVELKRASGTDVQQDGLTQFQGTYFFKPVGLADVYEIKGAVENVESQHKALQDILGLLLDSWVKEHDRADLLSALEIHMLHQLFNGDKVVPFRKRSVVWNHRPHLPAEERPSSRNLKVKKFWQGLLCEPSDALFVGQEIHRLLGHQFFIRINTPEEWVDYVHNTSAPLTHSTVLVELEKFPPKSFLIEESGRLLAAGSFLILQSSSAKKLINLPRAGSDFYVISSDLKRQFTYKYLKDCARLCLGLQPLYRYGAHQPEGNIWLS